MRLDPGYDVYSDEVGHCSGVMSANSDPKLAIVPIGYRPGPAADRSIVLISWDAGAVKLSSSLSCIGRPASTGVG